MSYTLSKLLKDSANNTINNESLFLTNLHLYEDISELCNQYPMEGYKKFVRKSGKKKHYSFDVLPLIEEGKESEAYNKLSQKWHDFLCQITSKNYIHQLFEILNIETQPYNISVSFFKYTHNDWVDTHIDNENKIVTNIFYFNSYWEVDWGGFFNLYDENNNLILSVPPLLNFSVAVKRTDQTFHGVSPVTIQKDGYCRKTLQLEIWKQ